MGIQHGGVAQLGEHLPCKQGVMGSNPIISSPVDGTNQVIPDHRGIAPVKAEKATSPGAAPCRGLIAQQVRARA